MGVIVGHRKNSTAFGSEKRTFNLIKKMDPKSLPKPGISIIDKLTVDKFLVEKLGFGGIPAYYNPRIHGPYRPDVYYGPKDTPLAKVKLGELPAWLSRRSADPRMMMACIGRANARWQLNYHHAVRPGLAPLFQIWAWCIVTGFVASYHKQYHESRFKYHW